MRILWAPWRMAYIKDAGKSSECIFCRAVRGSDEDNWVVYRSQYSVAMLNIYPYNTAHVMIAPKRHIPRLELLTSEEVLDIHETLTLMIKAIEKEYSPQGYNVGINIGRIAGAGIEEHLHIHVVPRWSGDTNFMPVLAGVKVIPEDLKKTYERLRNCISTLVRSQSLSKHPQKILR